MDENNIAIVDGVVQQPEAKARKTSKGLTVKNTNHADDSSASTIKGGKKKTIESQYRKLSQREHCLTRPDTYIGSVEPVEDAMFVLDDETNRLVKRQITYTPGLYKIFDESKFKRGTELTVLKK